MDKICRVLEGLSVRRFVFLQLCAIFFITLLTPSGGVLLFLLLINANIFLYVILTFTVMMSKRKGSSKLPYYISAYFGFALYSFLFALIMHDSFLLFLALGTSFFSIWKVSDLPQGWKTPVLRDDRKEP